MARSNWDSPAGRVIDKCGGIDSTAALVGLHRTRVNRWLLPESSGGTGGLIPTRHWKRLITETANTENPVQAEDFVSGMADA